MTAQVAIPWLSGGSPSRWERVRVSRAFSIQLGKMLQNEPSSIRDEKVPYLKSLHVQWSGINTEDLPLMWANPAEIARYGVNGGDLLVCEGGEVGRAAVLGRADPRTIIQNAVHRVRAVRENHANYLRYVLALAAGAGWFEVVCNRATIAHLTVDKLGSLEIPLPPPNAQRAIAEFLDRKTAAIDSLIQKKERLIELLQEKRQALITQAVTKGLDPSVPMKDSGVEWIGEIPAHWNVKRLMRLTPDSRQIMYGIVLPGPNVDGGIPIIKSGNCVQERLSLDQLNRTTREIEAPYARARVREGDIVYSIRGSVGSAALVPAEIEGANLTQDAARIAPREDVDSLWLLYVVQSHAVWSQLQAGVLGATVKGINIRDLKRPMVPVPPGGEQRAIAARVDAEVKRIDYLSESSARSCNLLREYRQALISAAVSGELDIAAEPAVDLEHFEAQSA